MRAFGESIQEGIVGTFDPRNLFPPEGGSTPPNREDPSCGVGTIENPQGQCVPAPVSPVPLPTTTTPAPTFTPQQQLNILGGVRFDALNPVTGIANIRGIETIFRSTLGRVAATPERVTLIGLSGRQAIVTPATAERLRLRGFTDI